MPQTPLYRHLCYDPKKSALTNTEGMQAHKHGLYDAVATAINTAIQVKLQNPGKYNDLHNPGRNPVILWANRDDYADRPAELAEAMHKQTNEPNTVNGKQGLPRAQADIGGIEIAPRPTYDRNGNEIDGLQTHLLSVSFATTHGLDTGYVTLRDNNDLRALCTHAGDHGYIDEAESELVQRHIRRLDTTSTDYMSDVGAVNDTRKTVALFLQQHLFGATDYYHDVDIAKRTFNHSDEDYHRLRNQACHRHGKDGLVQIDWDTDGLLVHRHTDMLKDILIRLDTHLQSATGNIDTDYLCAECFEPCLHASYQEIDITGRIQEFNFYSTFYRQQTEQEKSQGRSWRDRLGSEHSSCSSDAPSPALR